jgi:hypothetical protein
MTQGKGGRGRKRAQGIGVRGEQEFGAGSAYKDFGPVRRGVSFT